MAKAKGTQKSGGRAKGTPNKTGADVRAMARAFTKDAIDTLAEIMLDDEAPQQARAMAADKLLDRGWGKSAQTIAGDPENPLQLKTRLELVIIDPKS